MNKLFHTNEYIQERALNKFNIFTAVHNDKSYHSHTVKNGPYKGPVKIGELVPLTKNHTCAALSQTYAAFSLVHITGQPAYMDALVLARKFGAISKFEKKIKSTKSNVFQV